MSTRNVQHLVIIVSITLITIGLVMNFPSVFADTSTIKIFPKYIAVYQTINNTDIIEFSYFEAKNISLNYIDTNKSKLIKEVENSVDIPVGYYGDGNQTYFYAMYVLIDLNKIPKSDCWNSVCWNTVTINSIQTNALVDYSQNYTLAKTFVTLSYCLDDTWYQKLGNKLNSNPRQLNQEDWLTDRSCYDHLAPIDSIVVNKQDLPNHYSWDLTNATDAITEAQKEKRMAFSFVITGFPLVEDTTFHSHIFHGGIVGFYSLNSSEQVSGLGVNAVPSITLTYTTVPTFLGDLTNTNNLIAIFAILIPAIAWFYKDEIRKHLKGKQKPS